MGDETAARHEQLACYSDCTLLLHHFLFPVGRSFLTKFNFISSFEVYFKMHIDIKRLIDKRFEQRECAS
ncbi:hypothetical protein STEG23_016666, partial [Scotinomys teguina]